MKSYSIFNQINTAYKRKDKAFVIYTPTKLSRILLILLIREGQLKKVKNINNRYVKVYLLYAKSVPTSFYFKTSFLKKKKYLYTQFKKKQKTIARLIPLVTTPQGIYKAQYLKQKNLGGKFLVFIS